MKFPRKGHNHEAHPVGILYKSSAGCYRPIRVADGLITARCRFIKNASWANFSRYRKKKHHERSITKTCLYNADPLKPHFYIVKLGFTGVCIIFRILLKKHRLWVLVIIIICNKCISLFVILLPDMYLASVVCKTKAAEISYTVSYRARYIIA